MAITAPPALDAKKTQAIDTLISLAVQNLDQMKQNLIGGAIVTMKIPAKVSAPPIVKLLETYAVPFAQSYEKGWGELPGTDFVTMNGVTLDVFTKSFDRVMEGGIPALKTAVTDFNTTNPGWKTNKQTSKQFLYKFCGNQQIAGLFYYGTITSGTCRWPVAVMTEDPYLGYLLGSFVWESGAGVFRENEIDKVAKLYGWNGDTNDFAGFCANPSNRPDKTPELAQMFLQKRLQWISGQTSKDANQAKAWIARTVDDKNSHLSMLVIVNEMFNLNKGNTYQLTPAETQHLARKAEIYKSLKITIP